MHGINHDEKKLDLYKDEFGGPGFPPTSASSNAILKKLRDARTKLEDNCGSRVRIYMPPRNYIGHQTIAVLAQAGFDSFTCGPGTPDGTPDNWLVPSFGEVHSIWSYFPYGYGRTDEMLERSAHEYLIAQCLSGYDTVLCIHHTWETNIGFDHMDAFFSKIGNEFFKDFI
jgi:hypothetical protein